MDICLNKVDGLAVLDQTRKKSKKLEKNFANNNMRTLSRQTKKASIFLM